MIQYIAILQLVSCAVSELTEVVTSEPEQSLFEYSGSKPVNLLMISIDTWREDQFGPGSYEDEESILAPFISSLGSSGVYLSKHRSSSSWTYPSMSAALSGQDLPSLEFLPPVGGQPNTMPATAKFLPLLLAKEGYTTGLKTANGFLCSSFGIGNQYDYEQCLIQKDDIVTHNANEVRTRGLALATELNSQNAPWFVHLHLIDPHLPYTPPGSYLELGNELEPLLFDFGQAGAQDMQDKWDSLDARSQEQFQAHTKARYNALTRYLDDEIEILFTDLENQDLLEDTLVVIFSDHGEQLFEHGDIGHTRSIHSQEINTPVVFWAENIQPGLWREVTAHHDIVPTILEQLQLKIPAHITGLPAGNRRSGTVLFSYLLKGNIFSISATTKDYKLIYGWHDGSKSLYDVNADKEE